jgi:hypothetical protein
MKHRKGHRPSISILSLNRRFHHGASLTAHPFHPPRNDAIHCRLTAVVTGFQLPLSPSL